MKKIVLMIVMGILFIQAAGYAEEETEVAKQKSENNIAGISVQKQPLNENSKQRITKNIACIIIQVNGKVKDNEEK